MSRHRNVRTMNYHDEYDGYDDVYGHSVEDDFCCSPGTMEQYGYKRDNDLSLSSFMASDHLPEVDEESSSDDELRDSGYLDAKRKVLSEVENAKLNSCLDEMHSILGESVPERLMVDAVLNYNYDIEKALSFLLEKQASGNSKTSTKSQRDQRSNRSKKQKDASLSITDKFNKCNPSTNAQATDSEPSSVSLALLAHKQTTVLPCTQTINQQGGTVGLQNKCEGTMKAGMQRDLNAHGKLTQNSLTNKPPRLTTGSTAGVSPELTSGSKSGLSLGSSLAGLAQLHNTTNAQKSGTSNSPKQPGISLAGLARQHNASVSHAAKLGATTETKTLGSRHAPGQGLSLAMLANQHKASATPPNRQQNIQSLGIGLAHARGAIDSQTDEPISGLTSSCTIPKPTNTIPSTTVGLSLTELAQQHKVQTGKKLDLNKGLIDLTVAHSAKPREKLSDHGPTAVLTLANQTQRNDKECKAAVTTSTSLDTCATPSTLDTDKLDNLDDIYHMPLSSCHVVNVSEKSPSAFGQTLCSDLVLSAEANALIRSVRGLHMTDDFVHKDVAVFKFDSLSPDDIVQQKQQAAFNLKSGQSSYVAPSHPKVTSTPTPKVADSDIAGIASGVTRITFDTPQKVFKTPEPASARKNGATAAENKPQKQLQAAASSRESSAERSLLSTPKRQISDRSNSPANRARGKQSAIDIERELTLRKEKGQDLINLVVIGHVDAGKSTLMGHTLFNLGFVQKRTMQKYEHESKKLGKASFAYAWVLDETEEERSRGVTMDVAQTRFETATKVVTLLDAPGHKDFIPNMITGAAQADCAVLVVNATRGEFETGFDSGGQTREHAMLIRSLGVSQIVVAVNKMDTVDWAQSRFTEITGKLTHFLKQAGFRESDVRYVPCSGLNGENLTTKPEIAQLSWYQGPTLVDTIDTFRAPERDIEKSLRMSVSDVFKGLSGGLSVVATLKAGALTPGTKILVQPQGELATVKSFLIDEGPATCAFAGDSVTCVLTGIDIMNIGVGSILSEPSCPMPVTSRIRARVVIFNIELPITKGFMVVFHYQSLSEPAHIHKLVSQLHKSTGEVIKKKPRCLVKNTSAIIELEIARPICLELYKDYKELGRFMLRYGGATLAAGLVTDILKTKKGKAD